MRKIGYIVGIYFTLGAMLSLYQYGAWSLESFREQLAFVVAYFQALGTRFNNRDANLYQVAWAKERYRL